MQEQDITLKDGRIVYIEDNDVHRYKRPQNKENFRDNVFVMETEFKSGQWSGYVVPYHDNDGVVRYAYFSHDTVAKKGVPTSKPNFANGETFMKLRLSDKDNTNE